MLRYCVCVGSIFLFGVSVALAATAQVILSPSFCGTVSLHDPVLLWSENVADMGKGPCVLTFKSEDSDGIMARYNNITLPCGVNLNVYYTINNRGKPDVVFNCKNTVTIPTTVVQRTKHVTFDLSSEVAKQRWNISIALTPYEDDFFCSDGYRCMNNQLHDDICVDDDLLCDGVANCERGDDEGLGQCAFMDIEEGVTSVAWVTIVIIVICVLACVGCIVGIVFCCRRKSSRGRVIRQPAANVVVQPPPQPGPQAYQPAGAQGPPGYYPQSPPPGGYQPVPTVPPGQSYPPAHFYGSSGGYPPQAPGAYPPQAPGAYPPQAPGAYPPQASGPYPPQAPASYAPQGPPYGSGVEDLPPSYSSLQASAPPESEIFTAETSKPPI